MGELEAFEQRLLASLDKLSLVYKQQTLVYVDGRNFTDAEACWRKFQGIQEAIVVAKETFKKWKLADG